MSAAGRISWIGPMVGCVAAVLTAPLAAAVVASVYRFPVPFGDYAHGLSEAGNAALASVFYLVLGGVPVLAIGGTVAGWLVQRAAGTDSARTGWAGAGAGFGVALLGALVLATLEFFVGPW
ncbi:hypothetical protein [Nocardia wallacei]|uniref:hypothetical protein n=1 Tax=Nocardia wallacei TaxID=480035 RepID=UPI0024556959|nr:hypothetical protein [Nocardia wallacei]